MSMQWPAVSDLPWKQFGNVVLNTQGDWAVPAAVQVEASEILLLSQLVAARTAMTLFSQAAPQSRLRAFEMTL